MHILHHFCVLCEDIFHGRENVVFYFLLNAELRGQVSNLIGSIDQQFSKEAICLLRLLL